MGFANAARGLRLADTNFVYLSEGAYGVIFADRGAGRIRKIYRRRPEESHTRAVFESEAGAYERASAITALSLLVPGGFQRCPPQRVIDGAGDDISQEFFSDLAFEADFIDAPFVKGGSLVSDDLQRVRELFRAAGINHTSDISVALTCNGRVSKVIDFAIEEYELSHED